jgi:osmotically inducible protein OsmC
MKRKASAIWQGSGKEGKGSLTAPSKVLNNTPYSFKTRFEEGVFGTNPEELVAAAHAGCFSMKLSFNIDAAGFTADSIETTCEVTFEDGVISKSHLTVAAKVKGISKEKFDAAVADAEKNCPISRSLTAKISVNASLN